MYGPNRLHRAGILHAPAPAMGAFAGYGLAVHDGKCAMHKLGIQVLPSPNMMAIMHVEHWFGGHARILHGKCVCSWLQEVAGIPATRHQAEQRLVG